MGYGEVEHSVVGRHGAMAAGVRDAASGERVRPVLAGGDGVGGAVSRCVGAAGVGVGWRRGLCYLAWSAAAGVTGWWWWDPRFRDGDGYLTGMACLPLAAAVALAVWGWAIRGRWGRCGGWFALALIGQAVALQLIEAGNLVRYQHYKPLDRLLTDTPPLVLLGLVAQTAWIVVGLGPRWREMRAWLGQHFTAWQLVALSGVFVLASAPVARDVPFYLWTVAFATFVQAVNLANLVLVVSAAPSGALATLERRVRAVLDPTQAGGAAPARADRVPLLAALWVVAVAATLNLVSYDQQPHITDEVAYFLHARFLADGVLRLPAPPVREAFEIYLMQFQDGNWYASTPPGWPAVLAVGIRLGVPWLVNPLLGGVNILLTYAFVKGLYGRPVARAAVLLLAVSPWFLFLSMSYMNHNLTLACALAAAVLVARSRRTGGLGSAALAGVMVGLGTIVRPLDGLMAGVLVGLWGIGVGAPRLRLPAIGAFVLGATLTGAAVLPYNAALSGSATRFPLNAYIDDTFGPGRNDFGFGPKQGFGWELDPFPGHSPVEGVINANLNIFSLNAELFGWGTGSLLLVALALLCGRPRRSDWLMVAVCVLVFTAYFFYYFSGGPDFGARYWYLMIVPLVVLSVRGWQVLGDKLAPGAADATGGAARATVAVLALCAIAVVAYIPWRAIDKYHHFWGVRPDIPRLAAAYEFGRSLVLVRGSVSHPDFVAAAIYNPLDPNAPQPIYAWDRDPSVRARLLAAYADRPVWLVDGPSVTGAGFRVVAGPLSPGEVWAGSSALGGGAP